MAHFLSSVAEAWQQASQEQRNRLARVLFEEVRLDSRGRVVAVKPRSELEPFFKLSFECHAKDIAGDPEGSVAVGIMRTRLTAPSGLFARELNVSHETIRRIIGQDNLSLP